MTVYRLDLAYDGSGFRGYARQQGQRTVQAELETALGTLLKSPVVTSVAGRTDAGVHALGQVVSFEYQGQLDVDRVTQSLNGILGPEIVVRRVTTQPSGFHARFSATWRRYRYLLDQSSAPDPLTRGYVWNTRRSLDVTAMTSSASEFVGTHDFTSFCKAVKGKSNVRNLQELTLSSDGDRIEMWVKSNAFCHQMVRSIVGHLYDVGRGYIESSTTSEVIAARDRSLVATVAPSHGLTLMAVGYD